MSNPDRIGFRRSDPSPLVRALDQLLRRGSGWLNVQADPEEVDPRAQLKPSLFSGRGRAVPLSTFVPSGSGEHQIGVEHGAGRHAARQLRDAGVVFPDGARLVQDHSRQPRHRRTERYGRSDHRRVAAAGRLAADDGAAG
ncbi:MAG: hypothetical protein R2749_05215 [Acidimicrobiales bacterium]